VKPVDAARRMSREEAHARRKSTDCEWLDADSCSAGLSQGLRETCWFSLLRRKSRRSPQRRHGPALRPVAQDPRAGKMSVLENSLRVYSTARLTKRQESPRHPPDHSPGWLRVAAGICGHIRFRRSASRRSCFPALSRWVMSRSLRSARARRMASVLLSLAANCSTAGFLMSRPWCTST